MPWCTSTAKSATCAHINGRHARSFSRPLACHMDSASVMDTDTTSDCMARDRSQPMAHASVTMHTVAIKPGRAVHSGLINVNQYKGHGDILDEACQNTGL